ncbi:FAD/NAD(P)-binding domain-containing protein [Metschnikowia bicuspidata var. bicuspidata NRRL YB-4993]|uniref:FAD/NAD(P)-binding domain-containing protein n=1 Tax=Metschnikowia bicuspidata var. bicuspidata NRRL YB-4993 TaxID=869754 RepID=A0A1A0H5F0_9ASCO|nr:FAD/NAD(P)-binding domain-containing protein [Metschnikowia bicuspidata var. bicuspidata NRRL YB-4993]OBA19314.1 FAD/NAD(P)-binding domain-containing protein [Metschnikowia bicuspidata var. bicuspidata NRRL YB-4993]
MSTSIIRKTQDAIQKNTPSFHTNVLIVGGSYAGLSALIAIKNHLRERNRLQKISVTIVEPKAGFLNVLGVPRAIVDIEFAKTQFVPFESLEDIVLDHVISNDEFVIDTLGKTVKPNNNDTVEVTYVQGSITDLRSKSASYHLNNRTDEVGSIEFNYSVIATGRNRHWPTSPLAYNYQSYMEEMVEFRRQVDTCQKIAVIGAGAVGIEIAGDVKNNCPDKEVFLIHPHDKFPPEPLPEKFKDLIRDSLERGGVKVMTGYRVKSELDDHELEFTNGEKFKTDLNYWCSKFENNTKLLSSELETFISPKNNIHVNDFLQLTHPDSQEHLPHVFAIGDLVELPMIKSAGWALYMGRQVANNIVSLIFDGVLVEPMPDLKLMPKGMVIVAGDNEIVSALDEVLELNNELFVEEYKDYCIGKIRATLGA